MTDPVIYTLIVNHWQSGDIDIEVRDVDSDERGRRAIAYALRYAADLVENGMLTTRN